MTLIDKLNQLLQKAIDYTQEGLRQEGFHVDFQSAQNPNPPMQTGYQQPPQAYPMHPNLDEEQRMQYQQQQMQQQPKVEIQIDDKKQQNNSQTFIDINTDK